MATCRECLHYEPCYEFANILDPMGGGIICDSFKDKSKYAEVKHGEWEIKCDDFDCEYMMCSICKEEFYPADDDTVDTTPNFCPNCGTKMDGGNT